MRHPSLLLLFALAQAATAQDCLWNIYPIASEPAIEWADGDLLSDGGILAVLQPEDWGDRVVAMRWSPEGEVIWSKRVEHANPSMGLWAERASITDEGGLLVFGSAYPDLKYQTLYTMKLDPSGSVEWARIYMLDSVVQGLGGSPISMLQHPDGGFVLTAGSRHGLSVSKLTAEGVPIWTMRYSVSEADETLRSGATVIDPDGNLCLFGYAWDDLMAIHLNGTTGLVDWSRRYHGLTGYGDLHVEAIRASNGDYLVNGSSGGNSTVFRISGNGDFAWAQRYTQPYSIHHLAELANGHLLFVGDGATLAETDANGDLINAWSSDLQSGATAYLVGVRGDSLIMAYSIWDGVGYPGLLISSGTDALDCAMSIVGPTNQPEPGPTSVTDSVFVVQDSLKTWTMNIAPISSTDDLDVICSVAAGTARPGFQFTAYGAIGNNGGVTSGSITSTLTFDPLLSLVEAHPPPTSTSASTVTWDLPAVTGFGAASVWARFQVPPDVALLGTPITTTFSAVQDSVEITLANNSHSFIQVISGSYDPNDKLVWPRDFYHIENDSVLDYTIRFQNTGTDTAFMVVVRDTLPLDVDTRTFEMGAASHPYTYSLTGNGILTFTFENILLPDSNSNEPLSHGLVNFRIKPILPLSLGQQITNAADIYFDFNPPIRTPDATVVVTDETGVHPAVKPEKLSVYPVPVKNTLTAVLPKGFDPVSAFAIGVDGRRLPLFTRNIVAQQAEYRTEHLPPGAYVLTLRGQDGRRLSARFVKE